MEVLTDVRIKLCQHLQKALVVLLSFEFQLFRYCASSNDEAIISLELSDFTNNCVYNKSIKTLQKCRTKMLMQEVYISESKYLRTILVVPAAETIQIHSLS